MLWQNIYLQLMLLSCCLIIPVKHRLATAPKDWEYTSFHCYVRDGMYNLEWGAGRDITLDETIGRE
jgi:REP-associated tyrosine transposase